MLKRIVTGAVILLVTTGALAAGYFLGAVWLSAIWGVVAVVCVLETEKALGDRLPKGVSVIAAVYAIITCLPYILKAFGTETNLPEDTEYIIAVGFFLVSSAACIISGKKTDSVFFTAFLTVYPVFPLLSVLRLNVLPTENAPHLGLSAIILSFAVASLTDVFAYFCGSKFGKRKLVPKVSPNKTVEGAVGGLLGGIIGAAAAYVLFEVFGILDLGIRLGSSIWIYAVAGIFGSVFTQTGDLIASMVKRSVNIKDYSRILGSHGGFMDRFDGTMMSASLVYAVIAIALG